MAYRYISSSQKDGIAVVQISNVENKNAVNGIMNNELISEIERIEEDDSARVLILTGAGRIFCSGADMRRMETLGNAPADGPRSWRDRLYPHEVGIRRVVLGLHRLSKPAIAAVNGPAIGSGVGLAAGCDIRIAADHARLGWVFVRRGIVPDDASLALMLRLIGYPATYEWGVTGRTINARQAKAIGFVQHIVPGDALMATCFELAEEIIQNSAPLSTRLFKLAMLEGAESSLDHSVAFTERAQQVALSTHDHKEAIRAYVERRAPSWSNR